MRLELDSVTSSAGSSAGIRPGEAAATDAHSAGARGADGAGSRDSAHVSGASALLNSLSADRAARIQQLTAAVQGGSYQVSSAAISKSLVGYTIG